jgi:pimeloyl-ACP methyl ester carboxylesterase
MPWICGASAIHQKARANIHSMSRLSLLDGFMNEMGIGRVALIGHGLGALVALYYARQFPDLVDRVMAISYPLEEKQVNNRLAHAASGRRWRIGYAVKHAAEPVRTDAGQTDPLAVFASLNGEIGDALPYCTAVR